MSSRAACLGCDKSDDCWLWLVVPDDCCPDRRIETNTLDESSHLDRKIEDASSEKTDVCEVADAGNLGVREPPAQVSAGANLQNATLRLSDCPLTSTISCEARLVPSGCRSLTKRGYRMRPPPPICLLIEGPMEYWTLPDGTTLAIDVRHAVLGALPPFAVVELEGECHA